MTAPRFSIVIPTRNRTEALPFAVRTCLEQERDDFEIVVADNCSRPAASEVLAPSDRLRVLPAAGPLSMTDNWERAVKAARGEWIVLLGDDDGLLPGALSHVEELVRHFSARAVRWNAAYYTWPDFHFPEQANRLRLPLGRVARTVRFAAAVVDVLAFRACYTSLPMLYNAAVHRSVLEELIGRTGRVFASPVPDVYSELAVGHVAEQFVSCDYPLSVAGACGKSNGIASCFVGDGSAVKKDYDQLNSQFGLRRHPECPDPPIFPYVPVMDAYLHARDLLFADSPYPHDRKQFFRLCVGSLRAPTEAEWRANIERIKHAARNEPELTTWLEGYAASAKWATPTNPQLFSDPLGYDGAALQVDLTPWGIREVAEAAHFCHCLMGPLVMREAVSTVCAPPPAFDQVIAKEVCIQNQAVLLQELSREAAAKEARIESQADHIRYLHDRLDDVGQQCVELDRRLQAALIEGSLRNVPSRLYRKFVGALRRRHPVSS